MTTSEPAAPPAGDPVNDPVAAAAAFLDRLPKPQSAKEAGKEAEEASTEEPEAQPDVLTLSYSQLSTYQECEWHWYLASVLHTPRVPNVARVVGTALHAAFAEALTAYRDREELPTDDSVIDPAILAYYNDAATSDPDEVYLDPKLMSANERRLLTICRAFASYIRTLARRESAPLRPVLIEAPFNIAHPSDASLRLRGVVDLVTERDGKEGKQYAGVDWKSGRWFTLEKAKQSEQTEAYLLGAARMAMSEEGKAQGWQQLASFTYVTFPYDELDDRVTIKPFPSARSQQQMQRFLGTLSRVAREIRLKRAHASYKPHYSGACARCEVLYACERGQKWLTSHHITPRPAMLIAPPKKGERHDHDDAE